MMRDLQKLLTTSLAACALVACAQGSASAQRGRDDNKKDPPKQEKVVPKEDKQPPRGNDRPRDNGDQNRGRDNNNRRPPFFSFF